MAEQDQVSGTNDVNTSGPVTLKAYFLYPEDCPSMVLVPQKLPGSENYFEWKRYMEMALSIKNKCAFIDGSLPCPEKTDMNYDVWIQCDAMVISWLVNSVSPSIAQSILWLNTAKEVWDDLSDQFGRLSLTNIVLEIQLTRQGSLSVTAYFAKLRSLWYRLMILRPLPPCTCGALDKFREYTNTEQVIQFLMGLNDSFHQVKSQVFMVSPLPSIEAVFGMALRHERQLNYSQPQKGFGRGHSVDKCVNKARRS